VSFQSYCSTSTSLYYATLDKALPLGASVSSSENEGAERGDLEHFSKSRFW
jgi:hypothetical protein